MAIVVSEIGARALGAVAASGGTARVLAPLTRSIYLTAGDEIVWLASESSGHARAMVAPLPDPPPAPGAVVRVAAEHARRWRPAALPAALASATALAAGAPAVVATAARQRTHPISAALLGDLVAGDAYGPLHDLACALAAGTSALEPARRLTRLGHSSGWDLLAGFLGALTGRLAPSDVVGVK